MMQGEAAFDETCEPQDFAAGTYEGGAATGEATQYMDSQYLPPGFTDLESYIQNAHVPPRLTEEEALARKIDARRRFEAERRLRVFDAKRRTIGVDKEALDAQVAEKQFLAGEARDNKSEELALMRRQDRELKLIEAEKVRAKHAMERDCKDHSLSHLHFAARREYDLNDPKANRKELPARVGDYDPRCGASSLQQFAGEDLMKEERVRQQKEAMVNYIEQQRFEKAILADQGDGKEFVAQAAEIQELRNQMEDHEMGTRKHMRRDMRDCNKETEASKIDRKGHELALIASADAAELDFNVNGPMLTENSQHYKKNGKVVRETYKGSTRSERLAVQQEQFAQRDMDADKKQQERFDEYNRACEMEAARQVTVATERHRALDRRRAAMAVAQENQRLHEEQKKKTSSLNELFTNKFAPEFFEQFGKHTR
jgi:hypothetical protein